MIVTFAKLTALACLGQFCQPALYGRDTPEGTFTMQRVYNRKTHKSEILFHRDSTGNYTIHRVWRGRPGERRDQRLASPAPTDNQISMGCINVSDEMFMRLWQLPDGAKITITSGN